MLGSVLRACCALLRTRGQCEHGLDSHHGPVVRVRQDVAVVGHDEDVAVDANLKEETDSAILLKLARMAVACIVPHPTPLDRDNRLKDRQNAQQFARKQAKSVT